MSRFVDQIAADGGYKMAFSDPDSNWDIYMNDQGKALSIAKKSGCESSFFGDRDYIRRLIAIGLFKNEIDHITDYGREVMQGLYNKFYTDYYGKTFSILGFIK